MPPRHSVGPERHPAVQTNVPALRPAPTTTDRDIDRSSGRLQQLPQLGGAPVTDNRSLATSKRGCHPSGMLRKPRMTDGVHAAMNPVQTTGFHATSHTGSAHSDCSELSRRRHAVLLAGNPRYFSVGLGDFVPHTETKSPALLILPAARGNPRLPAQTRAFLDPVLSTSLPSSVLGSGRPLYRSHSNSADVGSKPLRGRA
jgi:hypothetical protein